jgi:hypothetical protein
MPDTITRPMKMQADIVLMSGQFVAKQ